MENSRHGYGDSVKAPFYAPKSRADMALRTRHHYGRGRQGLATGLMEMIPYWLMANPDIAFNPVTDGFTREGMAFTTKNLAKLAQNNPALYQKLMVERQPSEGMRYWMGQLGNPDLNTISREAMMHIVSNSPTIDPSHLEDHMEQIRQQLGPGGLSRVRDLNDDVQPCEYTGDGKHRWRTKYDTFNDKLLHHCTACEDRYYEDKAHDKRRNPDRYIDESVEGIYIQQLMRRLLNGETLSTQELERLQNAQDMREEERRR
jgi:hypothetical protein